MRLEGAQALVAGGASGLGAATARELASRGARVAVVDLDGDRAAALCEELGDGHISYKADVTSEAQKVLEQAREVRDCGLRVADHDGARASSAACQ